MKTLFAFSLISLALCLNGCGKDSSTETSANTTPGPDPQPEQCAQIKEVEASLHKKLNAYEKGVFYAYYCK